MLKLAYFALYTAAKFMVFRVAALRIYVRSTVP